MNPLTLVKRIQKLNSREADLGISEGASWHAKYKDSAYVFVGGIPYDLTEGDLLAIFAQCGEIVDVNLVRDKASGKSKGFAFVAYEDQRSTNLAVDNLNAAQILGRTIRVDHVSKYKKKEEEDEEAERLKREERGVCRAFQKGECTRGAGCKFSHDEQRAANTGWGQEEDRVAKWGNDKFQGGGKPEKKPIGIPSGRERESQADELEEGRSRRRDDDSYRRKSDYKDRDVRDKSKEDRDTRGFDKSSSRRRDIVEDSQSDYKDRDVRDKSKQLEAKVKTGQKEDRDTRGSDKSSSRRHDIGEDYDRREEKRPRRHDRVEYRPRENRDEKERDRDRQRDGEKEKRSSYSRDSSTMRNREKEDEDQYRSRR